MKMNSDNESATWCPFSNCKSRLILGYLKFWGCRKKNVGVKEEEALLFSLPGMFYFVAYGDCFLSPNVSSCTP